MHDDLDGGNKIIDKWKDTIDPARLCGGRKHSVPQVQPGDSSICSSCIYSIKGVGHAEFDEFNYSLKRHPFTYNFF